MSDPLITWSIYDHPSDFPDKFVARKFAGDQPLEVVIVTTTLAEARRIVLNLAGPGAVCFPRHPDDDPVIIETWI